RALGEHEAHRTRTLELQRETPLELQCAGHQRRRGHRLAERRADRFRVLVVLDGRAPAGVEAHQVPADRELLEQETVQQVARGRPEPASMRFRRAFTCAGFACPPLAFITWPTKKPNSFSFPAR